MSLSATRDICAVYPARTTLLALFKGGLSSLAAAFGVFPRTDAPRPSLSMWVHSPKPERCVFFLPYMIHWDLQVQREPSHCRADRCFGHLSRHCGGCSSRVRDPNFSPQQRATFYTFLGCPDSRSSTSNSTPSGPVWIAWSSRSSYRVRTRPRAVDQSARHLCSSWTRTTNPVGESCDPGAQVTMSIRIKSTHFHQTTLGGAKIRHRLRHQRPRQSSAFIWEGFSHKIPSQIKGRSHSTRKWESAGVQGPEITVACEELLIRWVCPT
jgi:hypothetical protein